MYAKPSVAALKGSYAEVLKYARSGIRHHSLLRSIIDARPPKNMAHSRLEASYLCMLEIKLLRKTSRIFLDDEVLQQPQISRPIYSTRVVRRSFFQSSDVQGKDVTRPEYRSEHDGELHDQIYLATPGT
jgi:hypothetical protein